MDWGIYSRIERNSVTHRDHDLGLVIILFEPRSGNLCIRRCRENKQRRENKEYVFEWISHDNLDLAAVLNTIAKIGRRDEKSNYQLELSAYMITWRSGIMKGVERVIKRVTQTSTGQGLSPDACIAMKAGI